VKLKYLNPANGQHLDYAKYFGEFTSGPWTCGLVLVWVSLGLKVFPHLSVTFVS